MKNLVVIGLKRFTFLAVLTCPAVLLWAEEKDFGKKLVEGARVSISRAPVYDNRYVRMKYPLGDPGWKWGACVDVVIRAFRFASNDSIDLQKLILEDIKKAPGAYGIFSHDSNIDHRRTRNLVVFFRRNAEVLPVGSKQDAARLYEPGDIVVWDIMGNGKPNHIGIVSDKTNANGVPFALHHFREWRGFTGRPSEDDCLFQWPVLHHFRWKR
ncbi:MAG TPA: DUF1287 domain-containing protein [candidate division Zixibacteria bacterium]|nr:DUF1287 domain-containing protein [candidate division Zixibacteria bacterium]